MRLEVQQVGDALMIVVPKDYRDHLGLHAGDQLLMTKAEDGFHLTRADDAAQQLDFAEECLARYHTTLDILSR